MVRKASHMQVAYSYYIGKTVAENNLHASTDAGVVNSATPLFQAAFCQNALTPPRFRYHGAPMLLLTSHIASVPSHISADEE